MAGGLLTGGLSAVFAAAFGAIYPPGRLHRRVGDTFDEGGSLVPGTVETIDCQVQVDSVTERMRQADGYTDRDVRLLILAHGLPEMTTDYQVEVLAGPFAGMWMVASVDRDPAGAVFDCRGRRA